eukprot:gene20994-40935_t
MVLGTVLGRGDGFVGVEEGIAVGGTDGIEVGINEGSDAGDVVGETEGWDDGLGVGRTVGLIEGALVGTVLGEVAGDMVGGSTLGVTVKDSPVGMDEDPRGRVGPIGRPFESNGHTESVAIGIDANIIFKNINSKYTIDTNFTSVETEHDGKL